MKCIFINFINCFVSLIVGVKMFTKDEKKVLSQLVKERIESLEKQEQLPTDLVANLAMDIKYEDFLKNILKKLKE